VSGFTFEVSLDDGLRRMIAWYRTIDFPAED
jgi:nucleoside-diphosphate-sugar epimerase